MPDIACVNGVFSALESASISINDRGFLFGDAVYEVIRTFHKKPFLLDKHLLRLKLGLQALHIEAGNLLESLPSVITNGIESSSYAEVLIYIHITRGSQKRNPVFDPNGEPNVVVTFRELSPTMPEAQRTGIKACFRKDFRAGLHEVKTTSLVQKILLINDVRSEGFYEALLYDEQTNITEGTTSSAFIVEHGTVIAPPLEGTILPGISREFLVNSVLKKANIPFTESPISLERCRKADEVFITATSSFLLPVVQIEQHRIGAGLPGAATKQILEAFFEIMKLG